MTFKPGDKVRPKFCVDPNIVGTVAFHYSDGAHVAVRWPWGVRYSYEYAVSDAIELVRPRDERMLSANGEEHDENAICAHRPACIPVPEAPREHPANKDRSLIQPGDLVTYAYHAEEQPQHYALAGTIGIPERATILRVRRTKWEDI